MSEKISAIERRLTTLENTGCRSGKLKMSIEEHHKAQGEQKPNNQEELLKNNGCTMNVDGKRSD